MQIEIKPDKLKEALDLLRYILEPIRVLPDCEVCNVCQDIQNRNLIWIHEMWKSREGFEKHLRSEDFRPFLAAMELAVKQPQTKYYSVSSMEEGLQLENF